MSSAFERSLRGVPTHSAASSATAKQAPVDKQAPEARKKKSVSWGDGDANGDPLAGTSKENSIDITGDCGFSKGGSGSGTGAKNNASFTGLGSIQEQGLDHLRVPSARPVARGGGDNARGGGGGGGGSNYDHHTASTANSNRRRMFEPNIQAGAVRVRTPAKPKRTRVAVTPAASKSSSMAAAAGGGQESRGSRTSPRNYLRRGEGFSGPTVLPKTDPSGRTRAADTRAASTSPTPARASKSSPGARSSPASRSSPAPRPSPVRNGKASPAPRPSPASTSPGCCRAPRPNPRRRLSSAGMALRSVAGGNAEDIDYWDEEEEQEDVDSSLLSGTSGSFGRSPCSPRPRLARSPRPARSPRTSLLSAFAAPPSPASSSFVSSFTSSNPIIEEDEDEEQDDKRAEEGEDEVRATTQTDFTAPGTFVFGFV